MAYVNTVDPQQLSSFHKTWIGQAADPERLQKERERDEQGGRADLGYKRVDYPGIYVSKQEDSSYFVSGSDEKARASAQRHAAAYGQKLATAFPQLSEANRKKLESHAEEQSYQNIRNWTLQQYADEAEKQGAGRVVNQRGQMVQRVGGLRQAIERVISKRGAIAARVHLRLHVACGVVYRRRVIAERILRLRHAIKRVVSESARKAARVGRGRDVIGAVVHQRRRQVERIGNRRLPVGGIVGKSRAMAQRIDLRLQRIGSGDANDRPIVSQRV
jgi:hypothetical protein